MIFRHFKKNAFVLDDYNYHYLFVFYIDVIVVFKYVAHRLVAQFEVVPDKSVQIIKNYTKYPAFLSLDICFAISDVHRQEVKNANIKFASVGNKSHGSN